MNVPKFKPTKWKVYYCHGCDRHFRELPKRCVQYGHDVESLDNIPFFVPDMKFVEIYDGWMWLRSEMLSRQFPVSPSRASKIIRNGIEDGGLLSNRWWMWERLGGAFTLKEIK